MSDLPPPLPPPGATSSARRRSGDGRRPRHRRWFGVGLGPRQGTRRGVVPAAHRAGGLAGARLPVLQRRRRAVPLRARWSRSARSTFGLLFVLVGFFLVVPFFLLVEQLVAIERYFARLRRPRDRAAADHGRSTASGLERSRGRSPIRSVGDTSASSPLNVVLAPVLFAFGSVPAVVRRPGRVR